MGESAARKYRKSETVGLMPKTYKWIDFSGYATLHSQVKFPL
jgi:hypothetical protein